MRTQNVEADITVVGGGLAGVCAAISAARLGKRVALIGNRPVLGGNSSSEVRVWVVGATGHGVQRFARESGVIGELYVENQYRNPEGNPIIWDEVVFDAVRAEPNISVFLNTDVREVDAADIDGERVVTAVHGWTMGSETLTTFTSPLLPGLHRRRPRRPPLRRRVPDRARGVARVRRVVGTRGSGR